VWFKSGLSKSQKRANPALGGVSLTSLFYQPCQALEDEFGTKLDLTRCSILRCVQRACARVGGHKRTTSNAKRVRGERWREVGVVGEIERFGPELQVAAAAHKVRGEILYQ
jgi:hypothetical protein